MPKIKVELKNPIIDGQPITFVAPCDCSDATGLKVSYPGGTKEFVFKDSHGNDLTEINELFLTGAYVRVIVDVANGNAFIQNADTNAYLEAQLASKRPNTWTPTASDVGAVPTSRTVNGKKLSSNITLSASDVGAREDTWMPTASDIGITGGVTTALNKNFSVNRAIMSNGDGKLASSAVTATELGYLDGVTSAIQTQLDGKADSATPAIIKEPTYHYFHLVKIGNLVICAMLPKVKDYISSFTTGTGSVPAGYRPKTAQVFTFYSEHASTAGTGDGTAKITVNTNGSVTFTCTNQATVEEFSRTLFWTID